jgi:hypothetical protein
MAVAIATDGPQADGQDVAEVTGHKLNPGNGPRLTWPDPPRSIDGPAAWPGNNYAGCGPNHDGGPAALHTAASTRKDGCNPEDRGPAVRRKR